MGDAARDAARCARPRAVLALALAALLPPAPIHAQDLPPSGAPADPASLEPLPPAASAPAATTAATPAGVRVLPSGGVGMEAAALLLSGQEGGMLPIAVAAAPLGFAEGAARLAVVVEIAGAPLLADAPSSRLYLELCFYALGTSADPGEGAGGGGAPAAGGEVRAVLLETLELDLDALGDRLAGAGIRVIRELRVPPGESSLRVLVREPTRGAVGLRVVPVAVPPAGATAPSLLAPLLAGAEDDWLELDAALPGAPQPGAPRALPLLSAGVPASLRLLAGGIAPSELRVQLRSTGGAAALELPVTLLGTEPVPEAGLDRLALAFTPPAGLAAGEASLRVVGGAAASPEHAVMLLAGEAPAAGWAGLLEPTPSGAAAASAAAPPRSTRRARRPLREYANGFRAVLQQLAGEGPAAAAAPLAALETRIVEEGGADAAGLADTEREVLAELGARDARALLPVLALYVEVFREAHARHAATGAAHARRMVLETAALLAAADLPEARARAAGALLAFVEAALPFEARPVVSRALQRAADVEPDGRTTLLLAAMDAEAGADHGTAIARLEELRRLAPELLEAQLRLAVNRARSGQRRQAIDLLAEVIAAPGAGESPPPWWLPVAYQELARLHLAGGRVAEAERVLRGGLARLPGEEKLTLQLALLLGADGRRAAALEVLGDLAPVAADRGFDSARHRYVRLPAEPLRRAAAELRRHAEEGRAPLAAALAAVVERR